jgi:hypothetical protein
MEMTSLLYHLVNQNDILFVVLQHLHHVDCLRLGFVSKTFLHLCVEDHKIDKEPAHEGGKKLCEKIWLYYNMSRIDMFVRLSLRQHISSMTVAGAVDTLKQCLGFQSYQHLHCNLYRVHLSLLDVNEVEQAVRRLPPREAGQQWRLLQCSTTLLRLVPADLSQCRGGFYCLQPEVAYVDESDMVSNKISSENRGSDRKDYELRLSIRAVSTPNIGTPAQRNFIPKSWKHLRATPKHGFTARASDDCGRYLIRIVEDNSIEMKLVGDDSVSDRAALRLQTLPEQKILSADPPHCRPFFSAVAATSNQESSDVTPVSTEPVDALQSADRRDIVMTALDHVLGMAYSAYGSHGQEILQISLQDRSISSFAIQDRPADVSEEGLPLRFGELQLIGLKVTGDPNIPAGNVSFVIDLTNELDPQQAVADSMRPVVSFSSNGTVNIINMTEEVNRIQRWFRGFGQINHVPSNWDPKWVGCSLLLYHIPSVENSSAGERRLLFSILWDDAQYQYQHMMHFYQLQYSIPSR